MLFLMGLYQTSSENDLCTVTTCRSWGIWCIRQRKRCLKVWLSVLSKNDNEKDFMARSRSMTEELAKAEEKLAKEANLGNEKSQRIASEIIDQLTTKKMEALDKDYLGIKKNKTEKK